VINDGNEIKKRKIQKSQEKGQDLLCIKTEVQKEVFQEKTKEEVKTSSFLNVT